MSLERLLELFAANDMPMTRRIILTHISRTNGDPALMLAAVRQAVPGADVTIAKGIE